MNKSITTLLATLSLASVLSADFTRVELGTGLWVNESRGESSYTANQITATDTSIIKKDSNFYVWAYIKHPIPVLPNLRLEYVSVDTKGSAQGSFKNFTAPSRVGTNLKFTQYDIIPYYNILDNTSWVTLDLGLDIKVIQASYTANGVVIPNIVNTSYSDEATIPLPLGYARLRVEIPSTDLALEGDLKYVQYHGSKIYDARIKVDYTLDSIALKPALEIGYRVQNYSIDDAELDAKIDLKFSGFYAGAMLRF